MGVAGPVQPRPGARWASSRAGCCGASAPAVPVPLAARRQDTCCLIGELRTHLSFSTGALCDLRGSLLLFSRSAPQSWDLSLLSTSSPQQASQLRCSCILSRAVSPPVGGATDPSQGCRERGGPQVECPQSCHCHLIRLLVAPCNSEAWGPWR